MDKRYVIKIGGNIIDDPPGLQKFLQQFSIVPGKKILVHGGGKLATRLADALHVPQQLIDGRRITDAETLRIVTMVYAGLINKEIVASLQALGCRAMGICGADADLIRAHKRTAMIDYGFAGDVDLINKKAIEHFFQEQDALVVAPITHNGKGQLLNTNADTIARELAMALCREYDTSLIYCFEKNGVLRIPEDDRSVIPYITPASYPMLIQEKENDRPVISAGMIPKLENAVRAVKSGLQQVIIGKSDALDALINGQKGTTIRND